MNLCGTVLETRSQEILDAVFRVQDVLPIKQKPEKLNEFFEQHFNLRKHPADGLANLLCPVQDRVIYLARKG